MSHATLAATGKRLIAKNGRKIKVQRLSATAADSNKPWQGAGEPTSAQEISTVGAFIPHTGLQDLGKYLDVDEELLKRCDQVVLIPGMATDLGQFNMVLDDSVKYSIEWVRALKPGTVTTLYAMGLRR